MNKIAAAFCKYLDLDFVKIADLDAKLILMKAAKKNNNPYVNTKPQKITYPKMQVNYTSKDGLWSVDSPDYASDFASRLTTNAGGGTARNALDPMAGNANTKELATPQMPDIKRNSENVVNEFNIDEGVK